MKNKPDNTIDPELYEVPENVTPVEAMIYDWVTDHYGSSEAENGSWNIAVLAEYINKQLGAKKYSQKYTVKYLED